MATFPISAGVGGLVGLPSSSSHAFFGGLIGATLVASGAGAVHVHTKLRLARVMQHEGLIVAMTGAPLPVSSTLSHVILVEIT
jgi:phosphate/sulfate permease